MGKGDKMSKSNYNLSAQEFVIMKHGQVSASEKFTSFTGELILTNQNLIFINKGVYGKVKDTKKIPINRIKIANNKAQVFITTVTYGLHKIEVYLLNGQEKFIFASKKDAERWVSKINQVITEGDIEVDDSPNAPILGTEAITSVIKGTKDALREAFGLKTNNSESNSIERVTMKCSYCGAPVSGNKNKVVRCSYCNSEHTL